MRKFEEVLPLSTKMPREAYLYFPQGKEIKEGEGKKGLRRIFEGQVLYDTFELENLQNLRELITKHKDFDEILRFFLQTS